MKALAALLLFVWAPAALAANPTPCRERVEQELRTLQNDLEEGDIIFHVSDSRQSAMLREATGSIWTHVGVLFKKDGVLGVSEASGSEVAWSSLRGFVRGSEGWQIKIRRLDPAACRELQETQPNAPILCDRAEGLEALRTNLKAMWGLPYDVHFQPGNEAIYCSEHVQKAYEAAYGLRLGQEQSFGEMLGIPESGSWRDLPEDSLVRQAIIARFDGGNTFDPTTPAVSPVALLESTLLTPVYDCVDAEDASH
jgi:hypothetical protein